ncbi:MAG TPA: hypothetical protein VGH38_10700 [Bryobacteraceae bacterium]|jgi:CRISPR type III-A-associated RAMP protein Csm4
MNPGLVIKLRPAGPWRIGPDSGARNRVDVIYHSDSLYSAVTSAMARLGTLDAWLDATARTTVPAVSFSSCFPFLDEIGFVVPPRTIWPPTSPGLMSARVRWKSARFVPLGIVQAILAGQRLDENHWSIDGASECLVPVGRPGPFRTAVRWSAGVDRLTGSTERHATACIEFRPGAGLWTIASFLDDAARDRWIEPVKAAFRLLADTGFGGERSRGWGRSQAPEFIDGALPEMIVPAKTAQPEPPQPPVEEPPDAEPPVEEPQPEPPVTEPPVEEPTEPVEASAAVRAPSDLELLAMNAEPLPSGAEFEAEDSEPKPPAPEPPAPEPEPIVLPGEPAPPPPEPPAPEPVASEPEPVALAVEPVEPEPPAAEFLSTPDPIASETEPPAAEPPATEPPAAELPAAAEQPAESEPLVAEPESPSVAPETPASALASEAPTPSPQPPTADFPAPSPPVFRFWLLSLYSPAADDSVDWHRGNYTLTARGGRIDSPAGSGELKKQVQMVAEGSVLAAASEPRGAAPDVAPDGFAHPVFRAGFAVSIPLPEVS